MFWFTPSRAVCPPATANIRFLILSDTHDTFPEPDGLPPVDVVLHCGDLTMFGGLPNYKAAIEDLSEYDTELVLVIPGNRDLSLDPVWWRKNLDEDDDPEESKKAHELFADAARSKIYLLPEGTSTITLGDGRSFTIYASPYTPEFNGHAFEYGKNKDRFNPSHDNYPVIFPSDVDIVMTHGPPALSDDNYCLDATATGVHRGCPKLWKAIKRTRPRLRCFGRIPEGYGAQKVPWNGRNFDLGGKIEKGRDGALILKHRESDVTVLLNAALMNYGQDHNNNPWVVEMERR